MRYKWYAFVLSFLAGVFVMNSLPHFIYRITGNSETMRVLKYSWFDITSTLLHVLWAWINILVAIILIKLVEVSPKNKQLQLASVLGFMCMSFYLSYTMEPGS